MRQMTAIGICLFVMSLTGSVFAAECEGVTMPGSVDVDGNKLVLNGLGIREATVLQINVYVAGLYLPAKTKDGGKASGDDVAKRLALKFVRDVDRADITKAWSEGFDKNAKGNKAVFSDRIKKLNSWMANMKVGDDMVFTYVPGKGIEVSVKGAVKGTVEGADFMKVFFSIWLGPNPPNSGLRTGLLGGVCG